MSKRRPSKVRPKAGSNDAAAASILWSDRLFKNTYTRGGRHMKVEGWSVKIQHQGRRHTFSLSTTDREAAALEAKAIYETIIAEGWDAALNNEKNQSGFPRTDARFWKEQLLVRRYRFPASREPEKSFAARIGHAGSAYFFPLGTSEPEGAASAAGRIYCAFDGTSISTSDYWGNNGYLSDYNYNAYNNSTDPFSIGGAQDRSVTSFNWQFGLLGHYYLPLGSVLIDHGDVLAGQVGLYDFTTLVTAFTKEGTSQVDIGYHYLGADTHAKAIDSNGDGLPDWWVRLYGLDPNVTVSTTDPNDLLGPLGDPDGDGLSNLQEYQLGSNPVRPDSQNITIGGYSYKQMTPSALPGTGKAYDVYYRPDGGSQWRRISSITSGQRTLTLVKPDAGEGDYIFLDTTDTDGDGLSDGDEYWFTYYVNGSIVRSIPNDPDTDGDTMKDGWEVAHGINPRDGSTDPADVNGKNYVTPGDMLDNYTKHQDYYADPKGYSANYDPLKVAGTTTVRPVVTTTGSHVSPSGDLVSFTITRDVGSGDTHADLTVYYAFGGGLVYGRDYLVDPPPQVTSPITDGYPRILLATIPAGQTSVTVTVVLTPKVVPGASQAITMTLLPYGSAQ